MSNPPSIIIGGFLSQIKFNPNLITGLPSIFHFIAIEGQLSFVRSFENHPTAKFDFQTQSSKDTVCSIFSPGRELDLFGIGYRVASVSCTEQPMSIHPEGRVDVSVSFSGKWENNLNDPCFLRQDGANTIPITEPFIDPECLDVGSAPTDVQVSLSTLFERIKIPLKGSLLQTVVIPRGTAKDQLVNPSQLLGERLRLGNSFVRFSNAVGLDVINIDGLSSHFIFEADILEAVETNYEGIDKESKQGLILFDLDPPPLNFINFPSEIIQPVPNLGGFFVPNLSFEYPVVELQGEFLDPPKKDKEQTQGKKPKYVKREVKIQTRIDGDVTADEPPDGVYSIRVMSLCGDLGGEKKTRTYVKEANGTILETKEEVWEFLFTGEEIYQQQSGKYSGNPNQFWRRSKLVTTNYTYDEDLTGGGGTGYLLNRMGSGYIMARWKTENPGKPETIALIGNDSPNAENLRNLYRFFKVPVVERHSRQLKLMPDFNSDDLFEVIKTCNKDGTSSYSPLINPDYAPPYYVAHELTEKSSFDQRSNPANDGKSVNNGDILQPDLFVGSLEVYESKITSIAPPVFEKTFFAKDGVVYTKIGEQISPQKWYRYNSKFSASGQAIALSLTDVSNEEGIGDLPLAEPRRQPLYKREEPADLQNDITKDEAKYKYLIWTKGYSSQDPISGTENFQLAKTFDEALVAAKCKLAIENWRNGYIETIKISFRREIKEGDRVNYLCKGKYRERVVMSVNHELNIIGNINSKSMVTGYTTLQLGRYVKPTIEFAKIQLPSTKKPGYDISVFNINSKELGNVIDWGNIKSRRNPG